MSDARFTRREINRFAVGGLAGLAGGISSRWLRAADTTPLMRAPGDENAAEPAPFIEGSWTIAALPDTQVYCERWPDHFYRQTEWIAKNKAKHDIQFVVHLGDITNRNTPEQWTVAQKAMRTLNGEVPYSLAYGNHDCGPGGNATTRDTYLNEYFSLADARKSPALGGLLDETRLDNSFHTFTAHGKKVLVLALEWGPRDASVEWAEKVVAAHADHKVLLTTHAYMYFDDTRYDWTKYGKKQTWNPHSYGTAKLDGGVNDGQQLWDKMIARHDNFFMTLNGHVLQDGLGRQTTATPAGNHVHELLVNYQMKKEGGEGFMRLVEFLPDGETVQIRAYSPSLDAYKTDPQNQFTLKLSPGWA